MARRSSAAVTGEATGSGRAVAQSLPFVCDLEKLLTGRRTLYNLIGRHACADHGYARPIYSLRQFGVIDYGVGIEPPELEARGYAFVREMHDDKSGECRTWLGWRRLVLNSRVPGFAEHAHPVASQDFRDVDGRVAVAHQFRAEEREVFYSAEILNVLECLRIVEHRGR
jgi:hypothetical protein